ncbi:hypothetical protein BOTCAL_0126g00140 [Botryotinia calthae]|uniref:Uncharacterized protein n=1 Tax=Botryotinia calthae TaxID=38488 RepID=A0A4Y8D6G2_9HELO|nr:hypothetical protein BOTCAL_0126g00140 [Botryotinia calthae]
MYDGHNPFVVDLQAIPNASLEAWHCLSDWQPALTLEIVPRASAEAELADLPIQAHERWPWTGRVARELAVAMCGSLVEGSPDDFLAISTAMSFHFFKQLNGFTTFPLQNSKIAW